MLPSSAPRRSRQWPTAKGSPRGRDGDFWAKAGTVKDSGEAYDLVVVGGAAIQATTNREGEPAGARPLDLTPVSPGYLRVLATPWAEVWVDGQRVDVTPFARAIPLVPGKHYVTLVHPSAPIEKRPVSIATGETYTIDVVMAVPDLAPKGDAGPDLPSAERDTR